MAYYENDSTAVMAGRAAEYAHVAEATPEFFRVFAVEPVVGRLFSREEQKPGGAGAVVISYAYWQSHFGGNTGTPGQTLRMFDKTLTIAGVLPPGFHFPDETDIWFPANTIFPRRNRAPAHNYRVVRAAETRHQSGAGASADDGHRRAPRAAISG